MMDCDASITVHNVDEDCKKYMVARICDREMWYWGSYDTLEDAEKTAEQIDGMVLMMREGDSLGK